MSGLGIHAARLQELAIPLVDNDATVVERLLDNTNPNATETMDLRQCGNPTLVRE
jgi:hypothetical protein